MFCDTFALVVNGLVEEDVGAPKEGEVLNWDLRASEDWWRQALATAPGYSGLAGAYLWGSLKFFKGDYSSMIVNPSMAGPFVHSFSIMGK